MEGSQWPAVLQGRVIGPRAAAATCSSGRVLDYIICSEGVQGIVQDVALHPGPWKSHWGVKVTLKWQPERLQGWRLIMPAVFPARVREQGKADPDSKSSRRKRAKEEEARKRAIQEDATLYEQAGVDAEHVAAAALAAAGYKALEPESIGA
eukprot:10271930-Lingulodinium_polyedra.AAC.1